MSHLATIGILSIGDMGMGVAKLLISQGYRVVTNLEGRRSVLSVFLEFESVLLLSDLIITLSF